MSCTTCGSNVNCNCSQPACNTVPTCNTGYANVGSGCCGTGSVVGCCSPTVQAAPIPYYSCAPACPEDHTQKIVINKFAADVKVTSSWNVPVCGESATVTIPGLTAITIGSYLWNPSYGYFEVTSFNAGTQQVTLVNRCTDGNATAGTSVAACTEFTVTDPPVDISTQSGVCVAVDFTAPPVCDAVGCCIDITVTTVNGLVSGGTVQIGTGFYQVSAVKPNDVITICNQGDGILPGTAVIAQDASGNYNYCLTILSSNPCEADEVDAASLVGCSENALHPLTPSIIGYIPTVATANSNIVAFRSFPFHDVCTPIQVDVPISSGTSAYNIVVGDSSLFDIGDILTVGGQAGTFTVSGIPDAFHLIGDFDPVPSAANLIGVGNPVCLASCCDNNNKFLVKDGAALSVVNSTVETTMFTTTIPAGVLDTNGVLNYKMAASILNVSGGSAGVTLKVKFGGTTLITDVLAIGVTSTASSYKMSIEFTLMNSNSLTAQIGSYSVIRSAAGADQVALPIIAANTGIGNSVSAINTAIDQTFVVTAQLIAADPALGFTRLFNFLEVM